MLACILILSTSKNNSLPEVAHSQEPSNPAELHQKFISFREKLMAKNPPNFAEPDVI
jgi:hypothetical protein